MRTYHLRQGENIPLYEQLYQAMKQDLEQGNLTAGEKLPSKRALAEHLGVSVITVENAYEQLMAEGYVIAKERKGYFVHALAPVWHEEKKRQPIEKQGGEPRWFMDFCTNSVTPENFPFSVWSRLAREVLSRQEQQLLQKQSPQGTEILRRVLAEFLGEFRGMEVHQEQIVVGAGTQHLYGILVNLLGRDKQIALENPSYGKIAASYESHGVSCCFIPMEQDGISLSCLYQSGAETLHLSPSHHFPTGIVTPVQKRWQLLQWARERGGYLIEDDYDSEFRFQGRPLPTMQSIDHEERVIYLNTFSKSISPAIGISYLILPPHLMERFHQQMGFSSCGVSVLEQYTLARFIEQGHLERHIHRMRRAYRLKRDALIALLEQHLQGIRYTIREEEAGLHFILQLETPYADGDLCQRAAEQGLKIAFLSHYYHGDAPSATGEMLMNYTGISQERMEEGVMRLGRVLRGE